MVGVDVPETVGIFGTDLFEPPVQADEIVLHEERVSAVDVEVEAFERAHQPPTDEQSNFYVRWHDYVTRWREWRDDAASDFFKWESRAVEFSALRGEYNALLTEFSAMNPKTQGKAAPPRATELVEIDKANAERDKANVEETPLSQFGSIVRNVTIIAVIGGAIYFLGPLITGFSTALLARRSA